MTLSELFQSDDDVVLRSFDSALCRQSQMTAYLLVHIAVIDARNLYLRAGFESMKSFCMAKMHLTEDAAYKRIQVARLGRQLPRLFLAIANGELSTYDVRMLAPRLTPENVDALVAECAHKTATEIQTVIARRFPRAEEQRLDDGVSPQVIISHSDARNGAQVIANSSPDLISLADRQVDIAEAISPLANNPILVAPKVRTRIEQLSESRFTLQVTLSGETHDKLRRLQDLFSHAIPNRDVAAIIDRSFDALMERIEKRKFGVGAKGISARIKNAVFERDGGRCAYRFEDDRICGSRWKLEFDHIVPLAKGGKTTVDNLRLLCRAHNQYAADKAFGQRFMDEKRASGAARAAWRRGSGRARSRP